MALYLAGQTLDKARCHTLAASGRLVRLMRGIYVDFTDDIDATVLRHGVRIAKYLYPHTYLSAASAVLRAPTADGRLYLSGQRNQRTRIRALQIIQNTSPSKPSICPAVVADRLGELDVEVSSVGQRFLEAFRMRSEHAASIDAAMRAQTAERLIEEYGTPKEASAALWTWARENGWLKEAESADRFLRGQLASGASGRIRNEAALSLTVAWHGIAIGHLCHDGVEWHWQPLAVPLPQPVHQTAPGKLPRLIASLLPAGWLAAVLHRHDERRLLRSGKRYLSNISIVEHEAQLQGFPPDILFTNLSRYTENGIFAGTYAGPGQEASEDSFESRLALIYQHAETPRLPGAQIKLPMHLDTGGHLTPSISSSFTHILKPAGTGEFALAPLIEWMLLELARAVGVPAAGAALVAMPDQMPPALLVERFDIRDSGDDRRLIALEDLGCVLAPPASAADEGAIERIVRMIGAISSAPDADLLQLFKRALLAWLAAECGVHLGEMALMKIGEYGHSGFRSVRVAALYDTASDGRQSWKLPGQQHGLRRSDFRALAATIGLRSVDAETAIEQLIERTRSVVQMSALPQLPFYGAEGEEHVVRMVEACRARVESP